MRFKFQFCCIGFSNMYIQINNLARLSDLPKADRLSLFIFTFVLCKNKTPQKQKCSLLLLDLYDVFVRMCIKMCIYDIYLAFSRAIV